MPDYTTISNNKSTSKGCFLLCIRCANLTLIWAYWSKLVHKIVVMN